MEGQASYAIHYVCWSFHVCTSEDVREEKIKLEREIVNTWDNESERWKMDCGKLGLVMGWAYKRSQWQMPLFKK